MRAEFGGHPKSDERLGRARQNCDDHGQNRANIDFKGRSTLAKIARDQNVAITVVRHVTKGSREKALYRGLGSIDITAACRSVLMVGRDPDSDDRRIVAHVKSNLAPLGPSLSYTIKDGKFEWSGEAPFTAEDLCRGAEDTATRSALKEAKDFLHEVLKKGPVLHQEVLRQAKEQGIAERTLMRAKRSLQVRSKKSEKSWHWQIDQQP